MYFDSYFTLGVFTFLSNYHLAFVFYFRRVKEKGDFFCKTSNRKHITMIASMKKLDFFSLISSEEPCFIWSDKLLFFCALVS